MGQPQDAHDSLPRPVRLLVGSLMLFFAITAVAVLVCRSIPHLHVPPFSTPFLAEHYPDLLIFEGHFRSFHTPQFFMYEQGDPYHVMYPAPVAVLYRLLYLDWAHPLVSFFSLGGFAYVVAAIMFTVALSRRGIERRKAFVYVAVTLVCCYPIWFDGKQANMEIGVWIFVTSGIALFLAKRGYSAAACFGIAASMKIFPLVYLGLFLARKEYRKLLFGVGVAAASTVVSLWLVGGTVLSAWHETSLQLARFRSVVMLNIGGPERGFDHSIFALIKRFWRVFPRTVQIDHVLTVYLGTAVVVGLVLYFARIRKLPVVNQVLCLTIASILFPPTSYEYTLQHLLAPLGMVVLLVVDAERARVLLRGKRWMLLCFAILLGFCPQLIWHGQRYEGQLKCLVLVALFWIALTVPLGLGGGEISWWERTALATDAS